MLVEPPSEAAGKDTAAPLWYEPIKRRAGLIIDVLRFSVFAVLLGLLAALFVEPALVQAPAPSVEAPEVAETRGARSALPGEPPRATETPSVEPQDAEATPFRLAPARWTSADEVLPRWGWWGAASLTILIGVLFLVIERSRRRGEIERDSPAFAEALADVVGVVHAANPTPRAVKLFENRMRYLAARLDAQTNPHQVDFVDRLVKRWLPEDWFDKRPPPLDERTLVVLGAERLVGPERLAREVAGLVDEVTDADRNHFEQIAGPRAARQGAASVV
jgi:hypothetical protein